MPHSYSNCSLWARGPKLLHTPAQSFSGLGWPSSSLPGHGRLAVDGIWWGWGKGSGRADSSLGQHLLKAMSLSHRQGRQFCPCSLLMVGHSCPTRQLPVLLLCGVGWERKCHCHRSPRQKTTESCCTMGTTITLQWSSTRAMCVCQLRPGQLTQLRHLQVVLPAAHQLPSSAGGGGRGQGSRCCHREVFWAKSRWL